MRMTEKWNEKWLKMPTVNNPIISPSVPVFQLFCAISCTIYRFYPILIDLKPTLHLDNFKFMMNMLISPWLSYNLCSILRHKADQSLDELNISIFLFQVT